MCVVTLWYYLVSNCQDTFPSEPQLIYPSSKLQQVLPGNPQTTAVRKVGRLTAYHSPLPQFLQIQSPSLILSSVADQKLIPGTFLPLSLTKATKTTLENYRNSISASEK